MNKFIFLFLLFYSSIAFADNRYHVHCTDNKIVILDTDAQTVDYPSRNDLVMTFIDNHTEHVKVDLVVVPVRHGNYLIKNVIGPIKSFCKVSKFSDIIKNNTLWIVATPSN